MVKRKMASSLGLVMMGVGLLGWSGAGYAQADPYGALISPYIRIPSNMQTVQSSSVVSSPNVTNMSSVPAQVAQPVVQVQSVPALPPVSAQVPAMPALPDMPVEAPSVAYIPPTPQTVGAVMPALPTPSVATTVSSVSVESFPRLEIAPAKGKKSRRQQRKPMEYGYASAPAPQRPVEMATLASPTPPVVAETSSVSVESFPRLEIAPAKEKKSRRQQRKPMEYGYASVPATQPLAASSASSTVDIASLPTIDIEAPSRGRKKNKNAKMSPPQAKVASSSMIAKQAAPASLELPSLPNEAAGASGQVVASVSDAFREAEARRRDVQSQAGEAMRDAAGYDGPTTEPTIKQLRELIPTEVISELRKQEQDLQISEKPGFIERVIPRVARKGSYPQQPLLEQPPVMIDLAKGKIDVNKPRSQQLAKAKTPPQTASMNFNPGLPAPANGGNNYLQVYDLKTSPVLMTQPKPKIN